MQEHPARWMAHADPRILLVDDDPTAVQMMSRELAHYRRQQFAMSGPDALRLVHEATPDLIVLDAELPGLSGFDVCDAMAGDPSLAEVPIIVASAHDAVSVELTALTHGATDFIHKSRLSSSLAARARAHLRQRQRAIDRRYDHRAAVVAARRPAKLTPRLLLIDDDVTALAALRPVLDGLAELHFATTPASAQRLLDDLQPELVLMDIDMPELDGFELFDRLQRTAGPGDAPGVAFVTRWCDAQIEQRAFDLGALDVIGKAGAPDLLRARVRKHVLDRRRIENELRALGLQWLKLGDDHVADIVGACSDAIVCVDEGGTVVLANGAAGRLFDRCRGGVIGRCASQALGTSAGPLLAPEGCRTTACGRPVASVQVLRADGTVVEVEIDVSEIGRGGHRLKMMVLRTRNATGSETGPPHRRSQLARDLKPRIDDLLAIAAQIAGDRMAPLPPAQSERLSRLIDCGRQISSWADEQNLRGPHRTGPDMPPR